MSTTWSITASDMIRGGLELLSAVDADEVVSAEDTSVCLRALQAIIKEMPLHGLSWPKLSSTNVAVTWSVLTPGKVTPPADYFGVPVLKFTAANGRLSPLQQIARAAFERLDLVQTGTYPQFFYEAPDKTLYLWPTPTQDPVLRLDYQSIASDVVLTAQPDVQQQYLGLFELWIADKVALKFTTPESIRVEVAARFQNALNLMQQWQAETAPIEFTVDNYGGGYHSGVDRWN